MRKFAILLALTFFTSYVHAQTTAPSGTEEEKDSVKVTYGKIVSTLTNARGYEKLPNGRWVSSPNRIPYDDPDYNNELYEKYLLGNENFKLMQVREMAVDGKPYYALIIQYMKGYYKNQEEQTDWRYFYAADYYLFDKTDMQNLLPDTIKFNKPYGATLRVHYAGTVPASDMNKVPARIGKEINKNLRTAHLYDTTVKTYFQFALYPIQDKRGKYMRFNTALAYAKTGTMPGKAPLGNFGFQYYELPFDRFKLFAKH